MTENCKNRVEDNTLREIRQAWGDKLLILGHYYIPDETLAQTDRQGDSLALAKIATASEHCRAIVFCGVHFMAETADILVNSPEKIAARGGLRIPVVLLDPAAGCPMADMAPLPEMEACWARLNTLFPVEEELTPITYVNSSAAAKAFCGRHGGAVCTSSNAREVLEWAFSQKKRVLFLPDQHLGRNTSLAMGIPANTLVLWRRDGRTPDEDLRQARVILWEGYCPVHNAMTPALLEQACAAHPTASVMVHPECCQEVVARSTAAGSTSFLIQRMKETKAGETVILGTESHLVERLRCEYADREVCHLGGPHTCEDMGRNTLVALRLAVEELNAGRPHNVIEVPEDVAAEARRALANMLRLG